MISLQQKIQTETQVKETDHSTCPQDIALFPDSKHTKITFVCFKNECGSHQFIFLSLKQLYEYSSASLQRPNAVLERNVELWTAHHRVIHSHLQSGSIAWNDL